MHDPTGESGKEALRISGVGLSFAVQNEEKGDRATTKLNLLIPPVSLFPSQSKHFNTSLHVCRDRG